MIERELPKYDASIFYCFNTGQMVVSPQIPYHDKVVKDADYDDTGVVGTFSKMSIQEAIAVVTKAPVDAISIHSNRPLQRHIVFEKKKMGIRLDYTLNRCFLRTNILYSHYDSTNTDEEAKQLARF